MRAKLKTFIPIFILGILMECAIFSAYKTKPVTMTKIVLLFVVVCICSLVLTFLPFVQRMLDSMGQWIKSLPQNIRDNKKSIIKNIIMLAVISVLALGFAAVLMKIHPVKVEKYVFPGMYMLSWTTLFSVIYGIAYRKMLKYKIEACVAILIMLLGGTYILAEPAAIGGSWDEGVHYGFAMMMSYDFELVVPDSEIFILNYVTEPLDEFDTEYYDEWAKIVEQKNDNPTDSLYGACKPRYQKWVYMPSALILLLCRALHLPLLTSLALGKFGFLIVYALLVFASMKKLQGGKMLVATLALLPQSLFLASHYSYDTWVFGWIMLAMCCFIYELQHIEETIDIKNVALMMIAFFVGVGPKAIYIPLMCLFLFMPKKKFKTKRQQILYCIAILVIVLFVLSTFLTPFLAANGGGVGDSRGGSDVNSGEQFSFILHNLGEYLMICWNFFKYYVSFSDWSDITSFLAYYGTVPFAITSTVMLMVVAFTDKCEGDANVRWYHRLITAVLSIGVTVLIITALYISFTPVGADTVKGCQPRYLLPLFFPMLYCIGSSKIINKMDEVVYRGTILSLSTFIVLYGIWTTIICKYV